MKTRVIHLNLMRKNSCLLFVNVNKHFEFYANRKLRERFVFYITSTITLKTVKTTVLPTEKRLFYEKKVFHFATLALAVV